MTDITIDNAMKTNITPKIQIITALVATLCFFVINQAFGQNSTQDFDEYRGMVFSEDNSPLAFANLTLEDTGISTITNNDGAFTLKVPKATTQTKLTVAFLGYENNTVDLAEFVNGEKNIYLKEISTELSQVNLGNTQSARTIVKLALDRKAENYLSDQSLMTAFYRETIKKRRRNVSLAEAVVNINKQPYGTIKPDKVALYKARKSTDYTRIDTVALKLQGGPLNALYTDLMKYPEYFLTDVEFDNYNFTFDYPTEVNGEKVFVVNFKQKDNIAGPLYYGKLYINSQSLALTDAVYSLNVDDRTAASELFVRKKPNNADVYPTQASYRVNYRQKDGKWYYGYSNVQLEFVIDWDRKLFNSKYTLSSEMAITDIELFNAEEAIKRKERYRYSSILIDEASGFSDPDFWGEYNVIEPDKSIESAIDKIKRQLKRG